jgi:hypothetical protein
MNIVKKINKLISNNKLDNNNKDLMLDYSIFYVVALFRIIQKKIFKNKHQ